MVKELYDDRITIWWGDYIRRKLMVGELNNKKTTW